MPIFNYEAELNRVSASQAYEMNLRGTMSNIWAWGTNLKWKNVRHLLNPNWRCPYCGFLSFGYTEIEHLEMGVEAGRQCCNIVLEALGYCDVPEEIVGCSILLRWPHEENGKEYPWTPSYDTTINIFKSGPVNDAADFASKVPFVEQSRPSGDTGSDQALCTIKKWIGNCCTHHKHYCAATSNSQLPKRVLELSRGSLRLREGIDSKEKYACLSHCWGVAGPALTLTYETIGRLKDGISMEELPRTFRDATKLCLRLDIRYLWIDALCIIQQDMDDWKEAAATMASIYENAFVTIAPTRSSDSEDGIFSTVKGFNQAMRLRSSGLYACNRRKNDFPQTSYALLSEKGPWPLLRRAWVFQERLLSTRIIHFTDYQVIWECKSMQESETRDLSDDWSSSNGQLKSSGSSSLGPIEAPFKSPQQEHGVTAWQRVVAHYSHLKLTFSSDRLPAIAAIAQRTMRSRQDDVYIAGIWKSSLLYDLAWHRIEYRNNVPRPETTKPTWSWASAPGAVGFYNVSLLASSELLDVRYTAEGPAHIGEVRDASIILRGRVLYTKLLWGDVMQDNRRGDDEPDLRLVGSERGVLHCDLKPQLPQGYEHLKPILWRFCPDYGFGSSCSGPDDNKGKEDVVSIIFLWHNLNEHRWFGLVLRRHSNRNSHERVGIADLSYFDPPVGTQRGLDYTGTAVPERRTCKEMIESLSLQEFEIA